MSDRPHTITGPLPALLGNAVSDALYAALERGMEPDEACCVALKVIVDYWRSGYGDGRLHALAELIEMQRGTPLPKVDR